AQCPGCRAEYQRLLTLRTAVQAALPPLVAPAALRARILAATIGGDAAMTVAAQPDAGPATAPAAPIPLRRRPVSGRALTGGISAVAVALAASLLL
ncbi:hypothetical protein ABTM50_19395, partial [Acinetobacter baumannii]